MLLEDFLPYRITALAQRVGEAIAQVHGDRFGLSRDEWRVLAAAGEAERQPTREVQAATGLDKVAVSRAASALEDRGLIHRTEDRSDRRIKILSLTEDGAETLAEVERVVKAREAYLLDGLAREERRLLDSLIAKLTSRAEAFGVPETASRCRPDCSGACERAVDFLDFPEGAPDAAPRPETARTLHAVAGE